MSKPTIPTVPFSRAGFTGWRIRLPGSRPIATPAIDSGRVFVGGGYGSHDFFAFDAKTGEELWRIRTDDDGPTAAVVAGGKVAFNTESCTLYVVDCETGQVSWGHWLGDPLMAQPAADEERVYMAYPDRHQHHLLACFELKSGEPLWSQPIGHDIITAPVLHGNFLYVSTYDGWVYRFHAHNGRPDWSSDYRATSAPWIIGEQVLVSRRNDRRDVPREDIDSYVSSTGRRSRRRPYSSREAAYLLSKRGTAEGTRLDELDAAVGFASSPSSARLHIIEDLVGEHRVSGSWRYQGSRPIASGDRCFLIGGNELECTDLASGAIVWKRSWNEATSEYCRRVTPPALANGKVFLADAQGVLRCLSQETGEEHWVFPVDAPLEWSPAVSGGCVYLGTMDGSLVCVETGDPADTGWAMWGGGPGHNGPCGQHGDTTQCNEHPATTFGPQSSYS